MVENANIFVTVGTTDFDRLVQAVDSLAPSLDLKGVMQIGHGKYIPLNLPYFRFAPTLEPHYRQASLVIAHGGLAVTMEVLKLGLPLVSVNNPDRYDNHQEDILFKMAEEGYLVWCRQLSDLRQAIEIAQRQPLRRYEAPECKIHLVINEFLNTRKRIH